MSRSANLRRRLGTLEHDFLVALRHNLQRVSDGADTLYFIVEAHAPDWCRPHMLSKASAARWTESEQIFELRALLGDPTEGTPAAIFREHVARYAEQRPNDLGPQRLASHLLTLLGTTGT